MIETWQFCAEITQNKCIKKNSFEIFERFAIGTIDQTSNIFKVFKILQCIVYGCCFVCAFADEFHEGCWHIEVNVNVCRLDFVVAQPLF